MKNLKKSSNQLEANTICPLCENNSEKTGEFQTCYKLDEFDNNQHNVLKCLNCNLHFMDPVIVP
jgi:hypothetical protein